MLSQLGITYEYLFAACGFISFLMCIFLQAMKFKTLKIKLTLIRLEFTTAVYLFAWAAQRFFMGNTSEYAYYGVRIATLLEKIFILLLVMCLSEFVLRIFMDTGKFTRPPRPLVACLIIPTVGIAVDLISQITHMYYSFDSNNYYIDGPLFFLSIIFDMLPLCVLVIFLVMNRKLITTENFLASFIFCIAPLIAGLVQYLMNLDSAIQFTLWLSSVAFFWLALRNQSMELTRAAFTERGTGFPNADGYIAEVDKIIQAGKITDYTAFYFDICQMGYINNKYGKVHGDEIIIKYGHNIKRTLEPDEIIGRLGGNYFVSLIKKVNQDKFLKLLKDVLVEIEYNGATEQIHIAAVAGGYEINDKNIPAGRVLGNVGAAIQYAKHVYHKPVLFFDRELEKQLDNTREIGDLARKSLKTNEFVPFYQPKVDTVNNVISGAEALVRWRHENELIPPFRFIPIMEKNGSICDLDFYVLNYVCRDIKGWIEQGIEPVRVSVNFSRKNLGNPILAEEIKNVVEKHNIPKKYIQIEITETLDEFPLAYLVGVVEALQRYGFTVAIDDFGTGSSSINLLKAVRFDILKIDKSFVDYENDLEKLLLKDIINMASDIGIKVIAEGVEERQRVYELREMGCTEVQGYVFDRPLEKEDFEKRLHNRFYA